MPKKLKEFYNEKIQAFDARRKQNPGVDYKAPGTTYAQSFDYVTRMSAIAYEESAVRRSIMKALNDNLTDEQIGALYDKLHNERTMKLHTKKNFIRRIREQYTTASFANAFGVTEDELLDAYEEALGPQKTQELISQPPAVAPVSPQYTGSRTVKPEQGRLDELEQELTAKETDAAKKQEIHDLFTRVSAQLENPDPALLAYYDKTYNSKVEGVSEKYSEVLDKKSQLEIRQGLSQLSGGKFADVVKPDPGTDNVPVYAPTSGQQMTRELSEEETEELQAVSRDPQTGLSSETIDAVGKFSGQFDALDYSTQPDNKLMKADYFPFQKHPADDQLAYAGEQGAKYYAFWPLVYAKGKLITAVDNGNLDEIRRWSAEYDRLDRHMQGMMDAVRSEGLSEEPNFSANVNSTREDTGLMPEKYASDYVGHNKLNSLYQAHSFSKNMGIPMQEIASDPYGTAIKASKTFLDANGTDSRPDNIGAALALNTRYSKESTGSFMQRVYGVVIVSALQRGSAGILALEKDGAKRERYQALQYLGIQESQKELRREKDLQDALYDVFRVKVVGQDPNNVVNPRKAALLAEKRAAIYANAAILPETGEDRFNMRKIAESLAKTGEHANDWRQDLSVEDYLNGTKPVDYAELAQRNKKIFEQMAEEQRASGNYKSLFDRDEYLRAAFRVQSKLLQNAPDRVRQTAGFQAFKKSVMDMYQLAESPETRAMLKSAAQTLDRGDIFAFLKTGKEDQFVKTDSPEYRKMKTSLDLAKRHLEDLRSDDLEDFANASEGSFPEKLQQAADDSFDYFRKKVENGAKRSFHYKSGEKRALEALNAVVSIRKAQDELGLRSPAQKMYEDSQLQLMLHRGDERWMAQHGPKHLASMLYAGKFLKAGVPAEEQKWIFEKNAEAGVQKLMNSEAIQTYVRDHKVYQLANAALDEEHPFTAYEETLSKGFREQYETQIEPVRLKNEKQVQLENYSLDLAADELKIDKHSGYYSPKNRRLAERAEEIRKRPEFRETVEKALEEKTSQQLKEERRYEMPDDRNKKYVKASLSLEYEKKCAEEAVRSMLRAKGNADPSAEQLNNAAKELRKDGRFRKFCKDALKEKDAVEIHGMNKDMKKPEVRQQTVQKICSLFAAPPELDLKEGPKVQPQKQPVAGGGPVQIQPH